MHWGRPISRELRRGRFLQCGRRILLKQSFTKTWSTSRCYSSEESNSDVLPWYLQDPVHVNARRDALQQRQRQLPLPSLPDDCSSLIRSCIEYFVLEQGLTNVSYLDLKTQTTLFESMVVATARSERHLQASSENIVRWLKKTQGLSSRAEGLLTAVDMKVQRRRKMRKLNMSLEEADQSVERNDWVCIDVQDEKVLFQIFTEEKRGEVDLEALWKEGNLGVASRTTVSDLYGQKRGLHTCRTRKAHSMAPMMSGLSADADQWIEFDRAVRAGRFKIASRMRRALDPMDLHGNSLDVLRAHTQHVRFMQRRQSKFKRTWKGRLEVTESFEDSMPMNSTQSHFDEKIQFYVAIRNFKPALVPLHRIQEIFGTMQIRGIALSKESYRIILNCTASQEIPRDKDFQFGLERRRIRNVVQFAQSISEDTRPITWDEDLCIATYVAGFGLTPNVAFTAEHCMRDFGIEFTPRFYGVMMTLLARRHRWQIFWKRWNELSFASIKKDSNLYAMAFSLVAKYGHARQIGYVLTDVMDQMLSQGISPGRKLVHALTLCNRKVPTTSLDRFKYDAKIQAFLASS